MLIMIQRENKLQKRKHRNKNRHQKKTTKPEPRFTNKISDHFAKKDFLCKESEKFKISLGLVGVLEELRAKTRKRITIVKGYECSEVAEKRGKVKRNFHTMGLAADISRV